MPALTPARLAQALGLAAALLLATALIAQYAFAMPPCALCIWQRWPYGAMLALGLVAVLRPSWAKPILVLMALALAVEIGIAVFHLGVEQRWWMGLAACEGGAPPQGLTNAEMLEWMRNRPRVACDQATPFLFGGSMALWNVVAATILFLFTLWGLTLRRPTSPETAP